MISRTDPNGNLGTFINKIFPYKNAVLNDSSEVQLFVFFDERGVSHLATMHRAKKQICNHCLVHLATASMIYQICFPKNSKLIISFYFQNFLKLQVGYLISFSIKNFFKNNASWMHRIKL